MKSFPFISDNSRSFIKLAFVLVIITGCTNSIADHAISPHADVATSKIKNSWFRTDPKYKELANGPLAGNIGTSLSNAALKQALEAEYLALENRKSGATTSWQYSNLQNGKITSYPPYQVGSSNCRRYVHSVSVNGNTNQATGTACRDKDGIWTPLT